MRGVAAIAGIMLALSVATACATGGGRAIVPATVPSASAMPAVSEAPRLAASSPPAAATPAAANPSTSEVLLTGGQTLVTRNLHSGKERTVYRAPGSAYPTFPAWSPNGSRFTFVAVTDPDPAQPHADWGSDLYVANANGSGLRLLLRHDTPGTQFETPEWAPDAQTMTFSYSALPPAPSGEIGTPTVQLRRLDLSTGTVTPVLDHAADADADLCADGRSMAYLTVDPDSGVRAAIAVANADGSNPHVVASPSATALGFLYPRFSPDCRRIVFAAIAGSGPAAAPTSPLGRLRRLLVPARAEAHNSPRDLWSVDTDGSNLRRLTNLNEDEPFPVWSRNGARIVLLGSTGLFDVNATAGDVKRLADGSVHGQAAWRE